MVTPLPLNPDGLLQEVPPDASTSRSTSSQALDDFKTLLHALTWLQILAAPHAYRALTRTPCSAHLIEMVDAFLAYARRGERNTTPTFAPVPYDLREQRAEALRAILETWVPPALTLEVVHAARSVLEAEGLRPQEGWDSLPLPPGTIDDYLHWPKARA